tara:strand:- start:380 stop:1507 length:1128 start_codon:yes stop_codon:yes gene_type:complete
MALHVTIRRKSRGMPNNNKTDIHRSEQRPEFWALSMRCCQLAATVDIAFFFIFLWLGSPVLAWVNVISVAMYACAYRAFRDRRNRLAVMLIRIEVLVHAALGTVLIGWDSGFHYFLLMFVPALFASMHLRSAWILAICLWGYYVGLYVLMWFVDPLQPISADALLYVNIFNFTVVFLMFAYLTMFYVVTVTRAHRRLARMATTDPLTSLFNRRHMVALTEKLLAREKRQHGELALLLMDLDHFKEINDQHGHEVGDRVLERVAVLLRNQGREQDFVGRWGGEEFLAVLPETDLQQAAQAAERIRLAVQGLDWSDLVPGLEVTLCVGCSQLGERESFSNAIARADRALYRAKAEGRNQVAQADGEASATPLQEPSV